jgi:putative nucleotidyltransferase with HDIG domain
MNFSVYNNRPIGQVSPAFTSNVLTYRPQRLQNDSVSVARELDKILNKEALNQMVSSNPVVTKLLKDKNIQPKIDVENFKKTTYNHCVDTKNTALGIYNYLPIELKSEANSYYIQKGAMLHDIGKVLIPSNILNKRGRLSASEADVMQIHSKLSESLLASQNVEPEVLNIVKYHHQNKLGNGYPEIKNTLNGYDINTEVVSLADKYSALTENRSYKKQLSSEEALDIIKKQVDKGEINSRVYNALVGYVNNKNAVNEMISNTANLV